MEYFYKVGWAIRTVIYSPFFGKLGLPGYIGKPTFLMGIKKAFIGKRVRIFPHMRLEVHGEGQLVIHDNVVIGQNFHITCGDRVEIGSGTLITADVMVTDIDHDYSVINMSIVEQKNITSPTVIGENCFIGMGARIQAGTILGKQCIVGTNSVVRGEFPDYSVIVGIPARVVKQFDGKQWVKANAS
jgi:acetyltransferase-like isoleucine patch superfamily enzyme